MHNVTHPAVQTCAVLSAMRPVTSWQIAKWFASLVGSLRVHGSVGFG